MRSTISGFFTFQMPLMLSLLQITRSCFEETPSSSTPKMLVAVPLSSSEMSLHCVSRRSNFDAKVGGEGQGCGYGKCQGNFRCRGDVGSGISHCQWSVLSYVFYQMANVDENKSLCLICLNWLKQYDWSPLSRPQSTNPRPLRMCGPAIRVWDAFRPHPRFFSLVKNGPNSSKLLEPIWFVPTQPSAIQKSASFAPSPVDVRT